MIISSIFNLKNGSSKSMNIDGLSLNQTFSYSPGNRTVYVTDLICLMNDPGINSFSNFGSIDQLVNGIDIEININEVITILTTIKDNADLCTRFIRNHFGNSALDTYGGAVGFGNTYNCFFGCMQFPFPLKLKDADSIKVIIKDNLTNIDILQMSVLVNEEI